ncbi:MAG TPA: acyl-CoA reductase, partial [Gemmatimonadota bacterium]|nr:acyl-CoA reductase [Gemmatimonadota bacterium]
PRRAAAEAGYARREGVPRAAAARVLDAAFGAWDEPALAGWIAGELGSLEALDRAVDVGGARRRAFGPGLAVFVSARGVPTTPVADLLSALCVKSAAWVKPATGATDLAAPFAATLAEVDPALAAAVEVAGWAPGSPEAAAVLGAADLVVATGGAETMAAIEDRLPDTARRVLHGPRLSAAVVLREALAAGREAAVAALADDAAFAGQAGCLSPVVAWVEATAAEAAGLAEEVAAACAERWPSPPRSRAPAAERAAWAEWVAVGEVESAAAGSGRVAGGIDAPWTVRAAAVSRPPDPPPVPRALVLSPIGDAAEAAALCAARRGRVAAVGVAGPEERVEPLAAALAVAGVERVCPLGEMQRPPLAWRRDGRPTLADLVRWVDRE